MSTLTNKIDFAVVLTANTANPNGDPLNGNMPRTNNEGYGEISDVCIKRKLRNRLQDMGEPIFVQSDERSDDGFRSLRERAEKNEALKKAGKDRAAYITAACEQWFDVRAFGQVFAFSGDANAGVSIGIRGPVSLHPAFSVLPVDIESIQITKSVNSEPSEKRSSDTMGMKYRVPFGVYSFCGSINCQLAEMTGFSDADAEKILEALKTLFENDASSARPAGSMEVRQVYWWRHNCKSGQYSSARVHRCLQIERLSEEPKSFADYKISVAPLDGLELTIYDGC